MTKRILITGGAGFVAHHVVHYFLENTDYDIVSLDRLDFSGNLNRLQEILQDVTPEQRKRVKVVHHDLKAELNKYVTDKLGHIDIILHFAAASHVTRSIKFPVEFVQDNIIGTVNLLEYARTLPHLERFIYFSTDEVFGTSVGDYRFREYDRYNATNPYSASKAGAEEMCVAYHNTYNLPIYITHTMNIFGERQSLEKYVPMTINKIFNSQKLNIHYDSKTNIIGSRSYLHAQDVADAMLFLLNLEEIKFPENHMGGKCPKFNISSDEEFDNLEIAQMISEYMGTHTNYELTDPNIERPGHDMRYLICGDYMRSLGWKKKRSVRESMKLVVEHTVKQLKEQNGL
jgi:dTDP-glucose 4,6-dehydratase